MKATCDVTAATTQRAMAPLRVVKAQIAAERRSHCASSERPLRSSPASSIRFVDDWLARVRIKFFDDLVDVPALTTEVRLHVDDDERGVLPTQIVGPSIGLTVDLQHRGLFLSGRLDQRLEIWRGEIPLFLDRLVVGEGSDAQRSAWGLSGNCVVGTLLITADDEQVVEEVRAILATQARWMDHAACSRLGEVVTLRYVGRSTRDCWKLFLTVWQVVRPLIAGSRATLPRIWNY